MNELLIYSLILIFSTLISSVSQVMLKKSAKREYPSKLAEYINPLVITAYILFFGCTFITMYALKIVPISMAPVLEATGYIFVAILSFIFLKERLSKRQIVGMGLIIVGIMLYSL